MTDGRSSAGLVCSTLLASQARLNENVNAWLVMGGVYRGSSYPIYILCGQVIEWHRLQNLKQRIISLYPNYLNKTRHFNSLYRTVTRGGQATVPVDVVNDVHLAWRTKPDNC